MTTAELKGALESALAGAREDLAAAYLFGSFARGGATGTSDVDIAVLFRETPGKNLENRGIDLAADIEAAVGRSVDLVVLNDAPVDLAIRVLREGRLLLERDRSKRIRFEVKARNEYFDLLPYLERYRAAALARAAGLP